MALAHLARDCRADAALNLLQFDQTAVKIFGVQKQHRLAVRADLGLSVAQNACALGLQMVTRRQNIINFVTNMMNAARRIFVQKSLDW